MADPACGVEAFRIPPPNALGDGTRRVYQLDPQGFESLRRYFDRFWTDALAAFKTAAEKTNPNPQGMRKEMTATTTSVQKSVTVKASADHAFRVFTAGIDSWWPRTHHIGKSPMTKAIIEGRAGGRCYSEQADGTECDWGQVLVWEPPHRFVMAWKITHVWGFEPDPAKASEVEIRFAPEPDGSTRVDLEHRHFERHGHGWEAMRTAVDFPSGWMGLLALFQAEAEKAN
jgi:hypothetical protein